MAPAIAWLCPGQGSQSLGMLANFAAHYKIILDTFEIASTVLDYDLWALTQQGPQQQLDQTEFTQPALLAAGVAMWRLWQQQGGQAPHFLAGHSLGEYTALVCAEALDLQDGVRLVAARGRYMQQAVPAEAGAMAAIIGLSTEQVATLCQEAAQGAIVSPANYNAHGQIVIAGQGEAVDRVIKLAKLAGSKLAKRLPVSVPSHCELMQPAAAKLANDLASLTIKPPRWPVINNVAVTPLDQADAIKASLVQQLYSPVQWVQTIKFLVAHGVTHLIESGPGKVLTGLNKRISSSAVSLSLTDEAMLTEALAL